MNIKINKAFYLIPVAYVAVIALFLYMQFSGSGTFNAEVSGIGINGKTKAGAPGQPDIIQELTISYLDIIFSFSEENPLLVFSQDGLTHYTVPQSYRVTASGIDIYLSTGITCSFYTKNNNNDTLLISVSAEDPESIKYITLPILTLTGEIKPDTSAKVVTISSKENGIFFLSFPATSSFDTETNAIAIYPQPNKVSELSYKKTAATGLDAFEYWEENSQNMISKESLNQKIQDFLTTSIRGVTGRRFNTSKGTWSTGNGSSHFYEDALVMAASETLGTSSYKRMKSLLDNAASTHSDDLTMLSASLFGNIVNRGWAYDQNLIDELPTITRKAEANDYSIFTDKDTVELLLTKNSDKLLNAMKNMVLNIEYSDISLETSIGMLMFYSDLYEKSSDMGKEFSNVIKIIPQEIIPSVSLISDRPYIVDSNGNADILKTFKTGLFLCKKCPSKIDEEYSALGRELLNSALLLADNDGILPETISETEKNGIKKTGTIRPETIYPDLTRNKYYPAVDYFYNETGKKICVLNQAKDFNMEKTSFGYKMTFSFPVGEAHTFAIRNMPHFSYLHMLGYKWNSDHRFLSYKSGWWFDKQHNTLYMKITQSKRTEEILIYN
ncbi:MAG: hypothetical protein PQJ46_08800 [Spirochaetales bacterium]|nr:hypothetical protein [Spirochaetales bacterium]